MADTRYFGSLKVDITRDFFLLVWINVSNCLQQVFIPWICCQIGGIKFGCHVIIFDSRQDVA